jgi:hypothetical protein
MLNVQWRETLLTNISEKLADLWVECADRAPVIIRQVLEFCSGPDPAVWFSPSLVIDVTAHRADIFCREPLVKPPFSDSALPLKTADWTHVRIGKVIKLCTGRDPVVWFPTER